MYSVILIMFELFEKTFSQEGVIGTVIALIKLNLKRNQMIQRFN